MSCDMELVIRAWVADACGRRLDVFSAHVWDNSGSSDVECAGTE